MSRYGLYKSFSSINDKNFGVAGTLATVGGLGALAGAGYAAYQNWDKIKNWWNGSPQPPPPPTLAQKTASALGNVGKIFTKAGRAELAQAKAERKLAKTNRLIDAKKAAHAAGVANNMKILRAKRAAAAANTQAQELLQKNAGYLKKFSEVLEMDFED